MTQREVIGAADDTPRGGGGNNARARLLPHVCSGSGVDDGGSVGDVGDDNAVAAVVVVVAATCTSVIHTLGFINNCDIEISPITGELKCNGKKI